MSVYITWGEELKKYYIRQCGSGDLLRKCDYLMETYAYIKRRGWINCGVIER